MKRALLAAALLALQITPTIASEFYVAHNVSTKKCKVVDVKPDGEKWVMVGNTSYASLSEAKAAKRQATECPKKR
jgi:hypothetical protein